MPMRISISAKPMTPQAHLAVGSDPTLDLWRWPTTHFDHVIEESDGQPGWCGLASANPRRIHSPLDGACGDVAVPRGVAEDHRTELLIHQDAGVLLRDPGRDGGLKAVVNHEFGGADLGRLRRGQ